MTFLDPEHWFGTHWRRANTNEDTGTNQDAVANGGDPESITMSPKTLDTPARSQRVKFSSILEKLFQHYAALDHSRDADLTGDPGGRHVRIDESRLDSSGKHETDRRDKS